MIISDTAIRHRTTVFVLMVIIAFAGVAAYVTLPREAAPDVQIPYITVTTTYTGVAPADMESLVTSEIEKKLASISGIDEIRSQSTEGMSSILVKFLPSTDLKDARQRVRDKVDEAKADMPDDIDEPTVNEINVSEFPIMLLNIHGPCGLLKLKDIAEDLQDDIESVEGVLEARMSGELVRQIRVEVDPYRLAAYRIPVASLFDTIARENRNVSGGSIDVTEAEFSVRVEGEFKAPGEMINLIIHEVGGRPVYLNDVAVIRDAFEDRRSISRFDGHESITLSVIKRAGENVPRIADEVKTLIARVRPTLPSGTQIEVTMDVSKTINLMVNDLENNMITGFLLVIAVLMVSIGLRNSALVATAIPFSMLITFAVIQALGITLNMIVLFSLILVLGMLVDNAIVIVENIYRHMQEGTPRIRAAMEATSEVAWPVITSTLTTLGAFVPLLFWTDIMGEFMVFLPKTVIVALLASLFVAMVINPTLSSVFINPAGRRGTGRAEDRAGRWIVDRYRGVLHRLLRPGYRLAVLLVAFACLLASFGLFSLLNGQTELFPEGDPARAQVSITMPVGTRLEATDAVARQVEKVVQQYVVTDGADPQRNIKHVTANVGSGGTSAEAFLSGGGATQGHKAQVSIEFLDFEDRDVPSRRTVEALRAKLSGMPGVLVKVDVEKEGPPTGKPVEIELSGDQYDRLVPLAERVKAIVSEIPGVADLDDDYDTGKPELRVVVDRQRARLMDLSTGQVAEAIKAAVNGLEVGKYREGNDDYDIVLRLPERFRRRIEDIEALTVPTVDGTPVPLRAVGHIDYTTGLASIKRIDEKRTISVSSDVVQGANSNDILKEARRRLEALDRPPGYTIAYRGEQEEQEESQAFLLRAGVFAILLIALILVTQFNSVALPLIILLSVVLSWIGVFLGLTITGRPFGVIMTGVGVISLAGVVVNNSIVLIDYTEKLRARGLGLMDAVIQAGMTRLRPVLLTAITTILGLLPMVLGWNLDFRDLEFHLKSESSVWWGPMASAVVFGLAVATILTLVVVPVVYVMLDGVRAAYGRHVHDEAKDEPSA